MYMVVSHWKPFPGKDSDFEEMGRKARALMREQDGLDLISAFRSGDEYVVVHAYKDVDAYSRIVEDENGPFANMMQELNIEQYAEWIGSERGETLE